MKTVILVAGLLCQTLLGVAQVKAHDVETFYDRVQLSASASTEVENDTVIATLYAEAEGTDAARLSSEVNTKIHWALEQVKKHSGIKSQSQSYTTSPVYRNNKIWGWRVRQAIRLESRDMVLMSEQLGELQQKLALQGMQFAVSTERKDEADNELIKQAMRAFENRARLVTDQLRRKNYRIVNINIATSGRPVLQRQYAMRAMVAESSPAVEAGEQTLQVTVSGEVELE